LFILFIKIYFRFGLGDIALDDIVVSTSCPKENRLCTFEDSSICNYVNDGLAEYNWVRTTGDAPLLSPSKPSTDHTDGTSNGAYMIVDISQSSSTTLNQRARLVSPDITPNGEQCVEFWYYSNSDAVSSVSKLNVFIRTKTQPTNTSGYLIWSKNILQVSCFYKEKKRKNSNFKGTSMAYFTTTYSTWYYFTIISNYFRRFSSKIWY
jgi:hypothetical protein